MLLTKRIEQWNETYHPAWLDFVRMGLGVFLFLKGIFFLNDLYALQRTIAQINVDWPSYWLALVIALVHIIGGIAIAIGLYTRAAILVQIPILIGAVVFLLLGFDFSVSNPSITGGVLFVWSDLDNSLFNPQWWIAVLTLTGLIVCWFLDSGPWSVDTYLKNHPDED